MPYFGTDHNQESNRPRLPRPAFGACEETRCLKEFAWILRRNPISWAKRMDYIIPQNMSTPIMTIASNCPSGTPARISRPKDTMAAMSEADMA